MPSHDPTTPPGDLRASVRATATSLLPRRTNSRVLAVVAVLLLVVSAAHLGIHLLDDRDWWATDAWRKGVTFPAAFGLTTLATAWVLDRLPDRRVLGWLVAAGTAGPALVESAAVVVQAWRGVPSHFNTVTPFDEAVFGVMGTAIVIQSVTTTVLLVWAALSLRRGDRAVVVAVVGGLLLLLVGAGATGGAMLGRGQEVAAATGAVGSTLIGGAGSLKVAHAVAIHGVELVLVALAAVEVRGAGARARSRIVAGVVVGLWTLFAGTAWQASSGMALQAPTAASGVALVGLVVTLGSLLAVLRIGTAAGVAGRGAAGVVSTSTGARPLSRVGR